MLNYYKKILQDFTIFTKLDKFFPLSKAIK